MEERGNQSEQNVVLRQQHVTKARDDSSDSRGLVQIVQNSKSNSLEQIVHFHCPLKVHCTNRLLQAS